MSDRNMKNLDKENERRRSIFDAGREAKRKSFGPGKNPYWSPLEREIWNNGWLWEPESYRRGLVLSGAVVTAVLLILALAQLVR
jgi:hypothetical protein